MKLPSLKGPEEPADAETAGGLWRSQDMKLVSIVFSRDRIKRDLLALGRLGCAELCDMNENQPAFKKRFTQDIRRCEELQRKVRYFREELKKWEPARGWRGGRAGEEKNAHTEGALEEMEQEVGAVYPELEKEFENYQRLKNAWRSAYETWQILDSHAIREISTPAAREGDTSLGILAGTIPSSKVATFERLGYRCTRGYCKITLQPLRHPSEFDPSIEQAGMQFTHDDLDRHIFLGVFHSQAVGTRLKRLAQSMDANIILEQSLSEDDRRTREAEESDKVTDCSRMIVKAKESIQSFLLDKVNPRVQDWSHTVVIHKGVSHAMNMLRLDGEGADGAWVHSAMGVAWVPKSRVPEVRSVLSEAVVTELDHPQYVTPPTHFETNKFTEAFQGIVNSYGAPRYKEVNPGVFTIITFPWLFGIMYGDIGHGLILVAAAMIFILFEKSLAKKSLNEMVAMVFSARYLLLLMGLFATYYGFLYNDTFGIMLEYSESGFGKLHPKGKSGVYLIPACTNGTVVECNRCGFIPNATTTQAEIDKYPFVGQGPNEYATKVTPYTPPAFGIDVQWSGTSRKLDLYNSFKMKSAVVIGVIQMMLGLALQYMNNSYYKDHKHIYFGFIPEVIFLSCTFGYMSLLIIGKWGSGFSSSCQVSLLEVMVDFFLSPGQVKGAELFAGQAALQGLLLTIAVICVVPFMLFPIPYIEYKYHNTYSAHDESDGDQRESANLIQREMHAIGVDEGTDHEDLMFQLFPPPGARFDMQEVVIKQIIHAIEYVLGSVSNTASYLRLWALSLAHAQLSEVFLEFLIMLPLREKGANAVSLYISFAVWLTATLMVLVGMEALSAFLHALRLHWVEFQNKFYFADGHLFAPLDLDLLVAEADEAAADH